jgi:hypothetical protein
VYDFYDLKLFTIYDSHGVYFADFCQVPLGGGALLCTEKRRGRRTTARGRHVMPCSCSIGGPPTHSLQHSACVPAMPPPTSRYLQGTTSVSANIIGLNRFSDALFPLASKNEMHLS